MIQSMLYSLGSVALISLVSLLGLVTFRIKTHHLHRTLIYLVSFSAGALLGDALIHLLPEAVEEVGFTANISIYILAGIIFSFIVEKFIHWRHCHVPTSEEHPHPLATMNLFGDAVHNFIDGIIIATSYLVSIPLGIATSLAVLFHEIPQEIGDFGVLLHSGFSKGKALWYNFLTATTSVLGVGVAFWLKDFSDTMLQWLIPFAGGTFIYIASADLIPELHKETKMNRSFVQLMFFIGGIAVMYGLLVFLE